MINNGMDEISSQKDYIVVIRAGSKTRFLINEEMQLNGFLDGNSVQMTFRTRYMDTGFESPIPRELWIDVRLKATSINQAIVAATNLAENICIIITFCTNSFTGSCRYHLAYQSTIGLAEREYFMNFLEDEHGLPNLSRRIPGSIVTEVVERIDKNPNCDRIRRALVQYSLGLSYWKKGDEILSVAHLYMGVEALTPIIRKIELQKNRKETNDELASLFGIPKNELDSYLRKQFIFNGDLDCFKDAKNVSDGFEHGFSEFFELRPYALQCRDKLAEYLRLTIIELLNLSTENYTKLLTTPYLKPLGMEGYVRYLRGKLISDHDNIAPQGELYPNMRWEFGIKNYKALDEGKINISFNSSITPQLGTDVVFQPESVEVYGPEGLIIENSSMGKPEVVPANRVIQVNSLHELKKLVDKALNGGQILELKIKTKEGDILSIRKDSK